MSEHTPTPWAYRPARHDDWGWIRGPIGDEGIAPLVATARSGNWESVAMLDQHRINKTDPYGANAEFIVKAVNAHDALVDALEHCLREHGGFTIKGETERKARAALALASPVGGVS